MTKLFGAALAMMGAVLGQVSPKLPPGVALLEVRRLMSSITPEAVFDTGGTPDWQAVTRDGVWVANAPLNAIHHLSARTNKIAATVTVGTKPCSGLAAGFGSIWSPSCGDKTIVRVDQKTNKLIATVPVGPAASEGGIAASREAIWMATSAMGVVSRIDPSTNKVAAEVKTEADPAGMTFGEGLVWVTSPSKNMLTGIDPKTNRVKFTVTVGPGPRFLTTGAGSVWTLNQSDGSVSRVSARSGRVVATIQAGIPGPGGDMAFGQGYAWATLFGVPITKIDPRTNRVVRQWTGAGGDSIRVAHGSVWLSNLELHNVWRLSPRLP